MTKHKAVSNIENETWGLWSSATLNDPIEYSLHEFYTGKVIQVPMRYRNEIENWLELKSVASRDSNKAEGKLIDLIKKVVKENKRKKKRRSK